MVSSASLTNYEIKSTNGGYAAAGKQASSVIAASNATMTMPIQYPPIFALSNNRDSFNSNKSNVNVSIFLLIEVKLIFNWICFLLQMQLPKIVPNTKIKVNSFMLSTNNDFYFRTLLRYVRSSSVESYKEKVLINYLMLMLSWFYEYEYWMINTQFTKIKRPKYFRIFK